MELISVTVGVQDPINKDVSVPEGKEDHWTWMGDCYFYGVRNLAEKT